MLHRQVDDAPKQARLPRLPIHDLRHAPSPWRVPPVSRGRTDPKASQLVEHAVVLALLDQLGAGTTDVTRIVFSRTEDDLVN